MPGTEKKKKQKTLNQNTPARARAVVPDVCKRAYPSEARAPEWAYIQQHFPLSDPCLSLVLVERAGPALSKGSITK